ncbi:MAG: hypothetical protein IKN78_01230 [Bacteroidales bacterium]|nr:hypothetical protein [Bacteroidales bacterium]
METQDDLFLPWGSVAGVGAGFSSKFKVQSSRGQKPNAKSQKLKAKSQKLKAKS